MLVRSRLPVDGVSSLWLRAKMSMPLRPVAQNTASPSLRSAFPFAVSTFEKLWLLPMGAKLQVYLCREIA
jgi:hypothetical protein